MNSKNIIKYICIVILLFFAVIDIVALFTSITSGYLTWSFSSETKSFVFTLISLSLYIPVLFGIWNLKKWAILPLAGLTIFGLILAIAYPPAYLSGNIINKLSNLPPDLFIGIVVLAVYYFVLRQKVVSNQLTSKL